MIISQLYSSNNSFKDVKFNKDLNIILGKVKATNKNDDHNLGKSKVGELIDYMLLKQPAKKTCFLYVHSVFKNYDFYLEIILYDSSYCTIKRNVENDYVKIKLTDKSIKLDDDFTNWDYEFTTISDAKEQLQKLLNFNVLSEYDYRTFIHFNIRNDEQIITDKRFQKYSKIKDSLWKSQILNLLGYDASIYQEKISLEDKITIDNKSIKMSKSEIKTELQALKNKRIQLSAKYEELTNNYQETDFKGIDENTIYQTVNSIDAELSKLNVRKYNLTSDISNLSESIDNAIKDLDFDNAQKIFNEVNVYFSDQLKKDYRQLIEFNEKLSYSRNETTKELLATKEDELKELNKRIDEINVERSNALSILKEHEVFKKMKHISEKIANYEHQLKENNKRISELENLQLQHNELQKTKDKVKELKTSVEAYIEKYPDKLETIKGHLLKLSKTVLNNCEASLNVTTNNVGNPEFDVEVLDPTTFKPIGSKDGKTYKALLTCFLDLSIAMTYSKYRYHHFIFHDSVLEGLDNRLKKAFIEELKRITKEYNIQYIFTAIEDDLKFLLENNHVETSDIALELTDDEDSSGTLFGFNF